MRSMLLFISVTGAFAAAAAVPAESVYELAYGITRLEHFAGEADGLVVMSRRENGNGHGFDVASFYVENAAGAQDEARLSILPLFKKDEEKLELTVGGGADCLLHDFRLTHAAGGVYLIVATREYGDTYVDERPVTFDRYELEHNATGDVGRPPYYFEWKKASTSQKRYCDVGDAFKQDLGLDPYRP